MGEFSVEAENLKWLSNDPITGDELVENYRRSVFELPAFIYIGSTHYNPTDSSKYFERPVMMRVEAVQEQKRVNLLDSSNRIISFIVDCPVQWGLESNKSSWRKKRKSLLGIVNMSKKPTGLIGGESLQKYLRGTKLQFNPPISDPLRFSEAVSLRFLRGQFIRNGTLEKEPVFIPVDLPLQILVATGFSALKSEDEWNKAMEMYKLACFTTSIMYQQARPDDVFVLLASGAAERIRENLNNSTKRTETRTQRVNRQFVEADENMIEDLALEDYDHEEVTATASAGPTVIIQQPTSQQNNRQQQQQQQPKQQQPKQQQHPKQQQQQPRQQLDVEREYVKVEANHSATRQQVQATGATAMVQESSSRQQDITHRQRQQTPDNILLNGDVKNSVNIQHSRSATQGQQRSRDATYQNMSTEDDLSDYSADLPNRGMESDDMELGDGPQDLDLGDGNHQVVANLAPRDQEYRTRSPARNADVIETNTTRNHDVINTRNHDVIDGFVVSEQEFSDVGYEIAARKQQPRKASRREQLNNLDVSLEDELGRMSVDDRHIAKAQVKGYVNGTQEFNQQDEYSDRKERHRRAGSLNQAPRLVVTDSDLNNRVVYHQDNRVRSNGIHSPSNATHLKWPEPEPVAYLYEERRSPDPYPVELRTVKSTSRRIGVSHPEPVRVVAYNPPARRTASVSGYYTVPHSYKYANGTTVPYVYYNQQRHVHKRQQPQLLQQISEYDVNNNVDYVVRPRTVSKSRLSTSESLPYVQPNIVRVSNPPITRRVEYVEQRSSSAVPSSVVYRSAPYVRSAPSRNSPQIASVYVPATANQNHRSYGSLSRSTGRKLYAAPYQEFDVIPVNQTSVIEGQRLGSRIYIQ